MTVYTRLNVDGHYLEKMNWENLKFIDYKTTSKENGGKKYYQQYLIPSFYLEIHFRWAKKEDLLQLHKQFIDSIGNLFTWHHNHNKSRESKIKDFDKAFNHFPEWLEKQKGLTFWHRFSNVGGTGKMNKPHEFGGIGDAKLEYWIAKESLNFENKEKQVQKYKESLIEFNTDMLAMGVRISNITVCLPIQYFKSADDLFHWIMSLNLIRQGNFNFATAGYRLNYYRGYNNDRATEILIKALEKYPGFEFDMPFRAGKLGRVLNDYKTDFIPSIKRLNWLTFVADEGVQVAGGIQKIRDCIEKNGISIIHFLEKGICIQGSKKPALAESDEGFNQYYVIGKTIEKLLFKPHERDSYPFTKEYMDIGKQWFYKFHPTPANTVHKY